MLELMKAEPRLSFRERIEGGLPVVCPACEKVDKMEPMGTSGWKCPWCGSKVLTEGNGKYRWF